MPYSLLSFPLPFSIPAKGGPSNFCSSPRGDYLGDVAIRLSIINAIWPYYLFSFPRRRGTSAPCSSFRAILVARQSSSAVRHLEEVI